MRGRSLRHAGQGSKCKMFPSKRARGKGVSSALDLVLFCVCVLLIPALWCRFALFLVRGGGKFRVLCLVYVCVRHVGPLSCLSTVALGLPGCEGRVFLYRLDLAVGGHLSNLALLLS